jgi:hypothetical protein
MNEKIDIHTILKAEKDVQMDSSYGAEDRLTSTFFNRFPANTDETIVAAKVAIIDTTNNTNISMYKSRLSLCDVAKIIVDIEDFDKRVESGDVNLVEEIARTSKETYGVNLFSFASKYCCYHNVHVYEKDDYSIFDNIVKKNLPDYCDENLKITMNKIESWRNKFDYTSFNTLIGKILDANKITIPNRRRAFDHFLWYSNRTIGK